MAQKVCGSRGDHRLACLISILIPFNCSRCWISTRSCTLTLRFQRGLLAMFFHEVGTYYGIFHFFQFSICISLSQLINSRPSFLTSQLRQSRRAFINRYASDVIRRTTPSLPRRRTTQPQRIHPPRRIRCVLVLIQPTRQLDRVGRQIPANIRIVVAMSVVVQAAFGVEILPLKAQRLLELLTTAVL